MVGDQTIGSSSQPIPLAMISALRLHPLGCRKSWPSGTPDASGTPSRSFAVVIGLGNHEESANCRCFFPHVLLEAGRGGLSHFATHPFIYGFYDCRQFRKCAKFRCVQTSWRPVMMIMPLANDDGGWCSETAKVKIEDLFCCLSG